MASYAKERDGEGRRNGPKRGDGDGEVLGRDLKQPHTWVGMYSAGLEPRHGGVRDCGHYAVPGRAGTHTIFDWLKRKSMRKWAHPGTQTSFEWLIRRSAEKRAYLGG